MVAERRRTPTAKPAISLAVILSILYSLLFCYVIFLLPFIFVFQFSRKQTLNKYYYCQQYNTSGPLAQLVRASC